ncbi:unnamed protein product [Periconia digitata]|uniref:Uncharacterized protein n=1 Tax=Periconia digitata TaxID=1303443 RepID=A0A9W4XL53_9PLEO|nr:unnamed protein product [Periconia digitata]
MPPALSDYESFSDSGSECHSDTRSTVEIQEEERGAAAKAQPEPITRSTRIISPAKKRKRGGMLAGLHSDNILKSTPDPDLHVHDSIESSAPTFTSSYNTRARPTQNSILYDQRYHPMDEVLRPAHAAQVRAKHEEWIDSEATLHSDSNSYSNGDENRPSKRPKTMHSRQGTRRTSRPINRNPLYNANLHPQDSDLRELDEISDIESVEAPDDESVTAMDDNHVVTLDDDSVATLDDNDVAAPDASSEMPSNTGQQNLRVLEVRDSYDESDFDIDVESYKEDSKRDANSKGNSVADDEESNWMFSTRKRTQKPEASPIAVYEDSPEQQVASESITAGSPDPFEEEDDDKENELPEPDNDELHSSLEATPDLLPPDFHGLDEDGSFISLDGYVDLFEVRFQQTYSIYPRFIYTSVK